MGVSGCIALSRQIVSLPCISGHAHKAHTSVFSKASGIFFFVGIGPRTVASP